MILAARAATLGFDPEAILRSSDRAHMLAITAAVTIAEEEWRERAKAQAMYIGQAVNEGKVT